MKCTHCNLGNYEKKNIPYFFLGERLGNFEALACHHCGETLFEAAASDKIEAKVKRRGLKRIKTIREAAEFAGLCYHEFLDALAKEHLLGPTAGEQEQMMKGTVAALK